MLRLLSSDPNNHRIQVVIRGESYTKFIIKTLIKSIAVFIKLILTMISTDSKFPCSMLGEDSGGFSIIIILVNVSPQCSLVDGFVAVGALIMCRW